MKVCYYLTKGSVEVVKTKTISSGNRAKRVRPALTPESREQQVIAAAMNLAEQQILDGTASSQVITHFLKLGSMREQLEREKLENENAVLRAKAEALESSKHSEELYEKALNAMRTYSGQGDENG